jgi:hypothetical protein
MYFWSCLQDFLLNCMTVLCVASVCHMQQQQLNRYGPPNRYILPLPLCMQPPTSPPPGPPQAAVSRHPHHGLTKMASLSCSPVLVNAEMTVTLTRGHTA